MLRQAQPPQSLPAFGIGLAVGFGAGVTVRLLCPGVVGLVNAVLSKLGFEIGDVLLALWHPGEKAAAPLQLTASRPAPRQKVRRKSTGTAAGKSRRAAAQPKLKTPSSLPEVPGGLLADSKKRRTPKNGRATRPVNTYSFKRVRPLAEIQKVGMN